MNNSLKDSLIIAICGAIFVAFLILLFVVRHVVIHDYRTDVETNDKKFAEVLSRNINYKFERSFDLVEIAAENPDILNLPLLRQRDILQQAVLKEPTFDFLVIVNREGKPIAYTHQKYINVDKNIYEWFKVMRPNYEFDISPAYYSEKTQHLVTTFVRGIQDNGETKAAILGDIDLAYLSGMINRFNSDNTCGAYLIDSNGTAIAQPNEDGKTYNYKSMNYFTIAKNHDGYAEYDENKRIKLRVSSFDAPRGLITAIRSAMRGEIGSSDYRDSHGNNYFCCYQPIHLPIVKTTWSLVIVHQDDRMIEGLDRIIFRSLIGGIIVIILIGFALNSFAKKITEPIRLMAEMATRVKNGDLSGQLKIEGDNELGELANNINHMIDSLRRVQIETKKSEEQLKVTAYYDALTGLPNRKYFLRRLRQLIEKSVESRFYGAMLFVDVDKFKSVNDTYGHAVGDGLLIEFAKRITDIVGNRESACRYGGDEFLLFLLGHNEENTKAVCNALVNKMREPFNIAGNEFKLSASVGAALIPKDANDLDNLLVKADSALYVSKNSGRDQFNFYKEGMTDDSKNMDNDF